MQSHEVAETSTDISTELRTELSAGLLQAQAQISPKYLYDMLGSRLFDAICALPEYYPTRTEAAIFDLHLNDIARSTGRGGTLIDLGAGNCAKAARLLPVLRPAQYVAIDISGEFLHDSVNQLRRRFPQVEMLELEQDFSSSLSLPNRVRREKRLFFYAGSSIGNFTPAQALEFLRRVRSECQALTHADGGLLIGADLIKDKNILDAAYDDALGVTAAFNLNVLLHANQLLSADFKLQDWQHRGFFNAELSRVEMHLEARQEVSVHWDGGERRFAQGERIHTENSYKYTREGFLALLEEAGFDRPQVWTDPQQWFMVCHAHARLE